MVDENKENFLEDESMTTGHTGDNEALVTFLQALALTIVGIDDLPDGKISGSDFLQVLDGYSGELGKVAASEGASDIPERVKVLRKNLDIALGQARGAKWGYDKRN